jgi:hypothetical protein
MNKRYIGLIIFVFLFITIISVVSILIARGYNFRAEETNGIINIETTPEGAKIVINGKEEGTTPKKIELSPGSYELRIVHENYQEWKNDIQVEPSIVEDFFLSLIPEELNIEQLTFTHINSVQFSKDGSIALYVTQQETSTDLWVFKMEQSIFDVSEQNPQKIASSSDLPKQCRTPKGYSIQISDDNTHAILDCILVDFHDYYIYSITTKSAPIHLNEKINFNPTKVAFGYDSNNLIIETSSYIANYSVEQNDLQVIASKKEQYMPLLSKFGGDFLLLEYSHDLKNRELYIVDTDLEKTEINIPDQLNTLDIVAISSSGNSSKYYAVSTDEGSYIVTYKDLLPPELFSQQKVTFRGWASSGHALLYEEGGDLQSLTIKDYPDTTYKVKSASVIQNFDSTKQKISWFTSSDRILLNDTTDGKIYALEVDGTNKIELYDGVFSQVTLFKLSPSETFLVMLLGDDEKKRNLYSVKLKV